MRPMVHSKLKKQKIHRFAEISIIQMGHVKEYVDHHWWGRFKGLSVPQSPRASRDQPYKMGASLGKEWSLEL